MRHFWRAVEDGGIANEEMHLDVQALLDVMKKYWSPGFSAVARASHRYGLIKEVQRPGNLWAHQEPFSLDEVNTGVRSYPPAPRGCWCTSRGRPGRTAQINRSKCIVALS